MSEQLAVYDEYAVRHEAAYAAFLKIHESKNPRPVHMEVKRDNVSLIIVIALVAVMISSIIVSSTRTVDEFGGVGIGTMAFIMAEGGILAYSFFRARRNASVEKLDNAVKLATAGLVLTIIVTLGANLDATLRHKGVVLPDWINTGINVIVALSAPALAFISSDVLAIELMAGDVRRREADKRYDVACQEWQEGANRSWANQQGKWGVKIEVEIPESRQISSNLMKNNQNSRRKKPSIKLQKALDYLTAHPEDLETPSRELEIKLPGISYGTIHQAQLVLRGESDER